MQRRTRLLSGLLLLTSAGWIHAADPLADAARDLVSRERVRSAVEAAFDRYGQPAASGAEHLDAAIAAIESLSELGEAVVPYLVNELEQERRDTFDFAAYALGMIRTSESEQALRDAIARAETEAGTAALVRKAWAGWALGLHGRADVVDLLNEGRHRAAHWSIHANCSVLEAAALQSAPESVERLIAQLERYGRDDELKAERRWTVRALRRLADPRAVPSLIALLSDPNRTARQEAAWALGTMSTPETTAALLGALADDEPVVRRSAALALERIQPRVDASLLLGLLDAEPDPLTRGALYRLVDRLGDAAAHKKLYDYWGGDEPMDRQLLVEALGPGGDARSLDLLDRALVDPDNAVSIAAVRALAELGSAQSQERLVRALAEASWTTTQVAAEEVARLLLARGGAPATERMLLAAKVSDPRDVSSAVIAADKLGRAVVELGYLPGARKLRRAADELLVPRDGLDADPGANGDVDRTELARIFRWTAGELDLIRANGAKVELWVEQMSASEPERRRLAFGRLARIGSPAAIAALVGGFDAREPADRVGILEELVGIDAPPVRALVERLLLDPTFDSSVHEAERDWAAWAARTLGGEPMRLVLEQAVARRHGRDARVLIYAALLDGPAGSQLIGRYRIERMRYLRRTRGAEQEWLDWLSRYLTAGRGVDEFDQPPSRLAFY